MAGSRRLRPTAPFARSLWRAIASPEPPETLGDFNASRRVIYLSVLALGVGVVGAFVAFLLLRLIYVFTNLFFFARLSASQATAADVHPGLPILIVPVLGGLIIGLMARYGSDRIRGHGIPEAIEAILINGARVQPRVALLKPLSSAISIGSGGPFGAEGPIILTGGALGSILAQFLHMSSIERRTLLVAGAAAGMSATFSTPVAAVLLAVELLLFEWKPRSLIPVAVASATAGMMRAYLLPAAPLFPVPVHSAAVGPGVFLSCIVIGVSAGLLSAGLTAAVYASEDAFNRLPIHWMWWPAIGGLVIGIGGLIFPPALGVGYPVIAKLLGGDPGWHLIIGVLLVKSTIWAVSLGSGTSGGVLAPLLMMGAALGGLEQPFLADLGTGAWPLIAMGAVLGGTMRSPLTGIVFVLELTHDVNSLLPLLIAVVIAHGFSVLALRRSILTEKVSRRGLHLGREYTIDPLENALVRHVVRSNVLTLPGDLTTSAVAQFLHSSSHDLGQRLFPILDHGGKLTGTVTRADLVALAANELDETIGMPLSELHDDEVVVARPRESLRVVANRMAETGRTTLPVIDPDGTFAGLVSLRDVLNVRRDHLAEEHRRERLLTLPKWPMRFTGGLRGRG